MTDVNFNDGLQNTLAGLGTTRDKASLSTYVDVNIPDQELVSAYRTSWLARKIVDIPALDSFRSWRLWQAPVNDVEKLEEAERALDIRAKLLKAYKMARLFGWSYVYYDFGDDPSQPLVVDRVRQGSLRFVTVLSHRQLSPGETELDILEQNYGEPMYYDVVSSSRGGVRIHPSRVIRLIGTRRPDDQMGIFMNGEQGDSVLYSAMQAIKQFDSTAGNIASLVYESKIDVISVKGLMNLVGNAYESTKLLERYRMAAVAKGTNGMLLLDGDSETYEQKQVSFAALSDILEKFALNASGAGDIPVTRLFGQSPSGMSATGESDTRNYYDRISSNQEVELRPLMSNLDESLIRSALGKRPPEIHYVWKNLWQLSDKERSDIGAVTANTVKTIKDTGLVPDEVLGRGLVSMLTQDSIMPGLETDYDDFFEQNKDVEEGTPNADEMAAVVPPTKPVTAGQEPALTEVADEQARAPKGTANGGQWVKGGGNGGAVDVEAVKAKALASVSNSAYPSDYIKTFMDKPNKEMTQGQYKKVLAYKKALEAEYTKAKEAMVPVKVAKPKIDPNSPESMKVFAQIGKDYGHGMKAETAKKLATGEFSVMGSKSSWQATVKAKGEAYLNGTSTPDVQHHPAKVNEPYTYKPAFGKTETTSPIGADSSVDGIGEYVEHMPYLDKPTPKGMMTSEPLSPTVYSASSPLSPGDSHDRRTRVINDPPPVEPKTPSQTGIAKTGDLTSTEANSVTGYTGSMYLPINKRLRLGQPAMGRSEKTIDSMIKGIDLAISKSHALKEVVLIRGAKEAALKRWLKGANVSTLNVGDTIVDPGYPSTTRSIDTAMGFGSNSGYAFKIRVPKGHPLLPVKYMSKHVSEDEFLLPRNSKFKVTGINGSVIMMDVVP